MALTVAQQVDQILAPRFDAVLAAINAIPAQSDDLKPVLDAVAALQKSQNEFAAVVEQALGIPPQATNISLEFQPKTGE